MNVNSRMRGRRKVFFWASGAALVGLAILAVGFGLGDASHQIATTADSARSANYRPFIYAPNTTSNGAAASSASGGASSTPQTGDKVQGQYLIKSLEVDMSVGDPRKVATDLQRWIATTDPHATSAGATYQQVSDNLYDVSLAFSVQSTLYPQIEQYLVSYTQQHGGQLSGLHESVQDATNDYIDTQSRLTTLRAEQTRLLQLLGQSKTLTDTLAIEQNLTDVEGQIEDIEAHLNALNGQLTFYTITINLSPTGATPIQPQNTWNPGKTLQNALGAAQMFGEWLLSALIWLGVFAMYLVPLLLIVWITRRILRARAARRSATPPSAPIAPTAAM
ncbi:MAG: DUF4349 domain-containing protein [Ktedonobacterales bacterium]